MTGLASSLWRTPDRTPAVFGEVVDGMDVVGTIRERDPQRDREPGDAIERVEIEELPRS